MSGYGGTPSIKIAARKQTDTEIPKGWLEGLKDDTVTFIKGDSNSGWAIVAEVVIGCVPVLGQLADARDIIKAIITLSASPTSPIGWFDLITALIGLVPLGGDAVKGGLRAVNKGVIPVDELLDFIRGMGKGNPEDLIRSALDLGGLQKNLDKILTSPAILNQLDKPTRQSVETIRKNLTTQFASFKKQVDGWLVKQPKTSAVPSKVTPTKAGTAQVKSKPVTQQNAGVQGKNTHSTAHSNSSTNDTLKQKLFDTMSNKVKGILGEHMADYHCQEVKGWGKNTATHDKSGAINSHKLNDGGEMVELFSLKSRGRGIDGVWKTVGSSKPYAIIEAKCSQNPRLTMESSQLLSELLGDAGDKNGADKETVKQSGGGLSGGKKSKKNPIKTNAQGGAMDTGGERSRDVKGKVVQMSHNWIRKRLPNAVKSSSVTSDQIKLAGYIRYVLFFTIPHVAAHAKALILKTAGKATPDSSHASHEVTKEWVDNQISMVVDNRAGLKGTDRSKFNRNK